MKNTKKTTNKPCFIVDLTGAVDSDDIRFEFIKAKALQGVKITKDDLAFIAFIGAKVAFETIDEKLNELYKSCSYTAIEDDKLVQDVLKLIDKATKPKNPWYKRFWGWITKPFKKNK